MNYHAKISKQQRVLNILKREYGFEPEALLHVCELMGEQMAESVQLNYDVHAIANAIQEQYSARYLINGG